MTHFKKILLSAALGLGLSSTLLAATEGKDYETLPRTMPQAHSNKVEVLEFFGYFCPHCKRLDPIILKHIKTFPSDTYFRTEHVVWDESQHLGLARLASAVNQSGTKQKANPAIYSAIFDNHVDLNDSATARQWLGKQTSFDGKKVLAAYDSFSNQAQAKQMQDNTASYNITGTPTVIVGGKYKVLFADGFENGMKTIDELVQKIRQERGMKAPAKVARAVSKGAHFAAIANH